MTDSRSDGSTRREFLGRASRGAAAIGIGAVASAAMGEVTSRPADKKKPKYPEPSLPYGTLGKTEYPATLVSFGGILLQESLGTRVLKAGIDGGINLLHTSASYGRGKSVASISELFKADRKYRDKVFLLLKCFNPEKEKEVDDMLESLGTDHVEAVMTTFDDANVKRLDALRKQQDMLKKKGKVLHTGFVCHGDMNGVMELILKEAPDYFDMSLIAMRMVPGGQLKTEPQARAEGERFLKNLAAFRQQGIGILGMKTDARTVVTQGREAFEPHVKAVLKAGADTLLTSVNTFDQVDMIKELDLKSPHSRPAEPKTSACNEGGSNGCLMCARCAKACPRGLPVNDLMRFGMYDQDYGWHEHARSEYAARGVDFNRLARDCGECSACADACPIGLASSDTVRRLASLFA